MLTYLEACAQEYQARLRAEGRVEGRVEGRAEALDENKVCLCKRAERRFGVSIHSGEYLGPRRLALARTKGGKVRPAGAGWARSPRWGSSLRRWASVVGKLASWPQRGVKLRAGQGCRVRERVLPLAARWPESSSVWEVRGVPPCAARPSLTGAMGTGPMGPGPGCAHRHPANPAGTGTGSAQPLSLSAAR